MTRYSLTRNDGWWQVRCYRDGRYAWGRAFSDWTEAYAHLGRWLEWARR